MLARDKIKDKNIVVSTHIYATGAATDLKEYLIQTKIKRFLYIFHPLFYDPQIPGSGYELYENGKLIKIFQKKHIKLPLFLTFIIHSIYTFIWTFTLSKHDWDIFIGSNNLNAFLGLILKTVKKVKKNIYYVIDYNPYRYQNKIANWFYHFIEVISAKYSDETWNLSQNMIDARKKFRSFNGGTQKVVPIGIWFKRFSDLHKLKKNYLEIAYMGHVIKRNGIQHFLNALPIILKKNPNVTFKIIGGGDYINALKLLSRKLKVFKNVSFTGFVPDHRDIELMLAKSILGVALYDREVEPNKPNLTQFADPAKLKSYLATGLPIIMTKVPHLANDLVQKGCGVVVSYDEKEIATKTIELLENKKRLDQMRKNAIQYASMYDWNLIFKKAFKSMV